MMAAVAGQVLGRGQRVVFVDAARVAVTMVVPFTLQVHQRMRPFFKVRHHCSNAGMGQRLPAHAEHQDEGREATAHNAKSSGAVEVASR